MEDLDFPNIQLDDQAKFYRLSSDIKNNDKCLMMLKVFHDTEDLIVTIKLLDWEKEEQIDIYKQKSNPYKALLKLFINYFNDLEKLNTHLQEQQMFSLFSPASEARKRTLLVNSENFQKELKTVSTNVRTTISNAVNQGRFSTEVCFNDWYVKENFDLLTVVRDELIKSGYTISKWEKYDGEFEGTSFFTVSW